MKPVMRQTWRDLTFLHWAYNAELVRPLVPRGLELDLFDGMAWIGLVPFRIVDLTLPRAPTIPWLSHFCETNVRTYVRNGRGEAGVWFFSLDAARLAAVIGARAAYALPYYWAEMRVRREGGRVEYWSSRRLGGVAECELEVEVGERIAEQDAREIFLTRRMRLYAERGGRILSADIEHPEGPLQRARVLRLRESMVAAAGMPGPAGEALAHFSESINVLVEWPKRD